MSHRTAGQIAADSRLLQRDDMVEALAGRDFGTAFKLLQRFQGLTQGEIAAATGLTQGRVSKLISSRRNRILHIDVIERILDGLRIPGNDCATSRTSPRISASKSYGSPRRRSSVRRSGTSGPSGVS